MTDARLIDTEFVAYQPDLAVALTSPTRALIVQVLWFARDRKTNEVGMTLVRLALKIGVSVRTIQRHAEVLVEMGVLEKNRHSKFDATTYWTIHPEAIPEAPEVPPPDGDALDVDTLSDSTGQDDHLDVDTLSTSTSLRTSTTNSPLVTTSPEVVKSLNPMPTEALFGHLQDPPQWVKDQPWMNQELYRLACARARHVNVLEQIENVVVWCKDQGKQPQGSLLLTFITRAETEWETAHRAAPGDDDWVARSARALTQQALAAREEEK